MSSDTIVGLVKDLTAQLSGIALEFGDRADRVARDMHAGERARRSLKQQAELLLTQRAVRSETLPAELFHEPAWDMLLALFVAGEEGRAMNVKSLVACAQAPVTTSQRWIEHLHKLKLIDRIIDPTDRRRVEINLSETGTRAIRDYLAPLTLD